MINITQLPVTGYCPRLRAVTLEALQPAREFNTSAEEVPV